MSGGLKALLLASLAIVSVLLCAAGADAEPVFKTARGEFLKGRQSGSDRFFVGGVEIGCGKATYLGPPTVRSETLELEPEYGDCTVEALSGLPSRFVQKRCLYVLHRVRRAPGKQRWTAKVSLRCYNGNVAVGWDVYETGGVFERVRSPCHISVPAQPAAGTAELRNLGHRREIEVRWHFDDLMYRIATPRGAGSSSLLCGGTEGETSHGARYEGAAILSANDIVGHRGRLWLSG